MNDEETIDAAHKMAEHIEIEYRRIGFCIMCLHKKHLSDCPVLKLLHPELGIWIHENDERDTIVEFNQAAADYIADTMNGQV